MALNDVAIVTVRNSSSRLPNKAIMKIKDDIRSIDIVLERAKKTNLPVILATSTSESDDIFETIAKEHDVLIFRGALLNKIKRWYDCFNQFDISNALLLDGDDLCHNFSLGIRALNELKSKHIDLLMNPDDIVTGFFTFAISKSGITKLYHIIPYETSNTDVITRYIEKADLITDYVTLEDYEINKNIRLTLDYEEDLQFFRKLYENFSIVESGEQIINFLKEHTEVIKINFHRQKDFLENQAKFNENVK